jgi:predicted PurR-regulated permease PerM
MIKKIEISHKTIIFTVLFLIFVWILYQIKDVILIFFVSLMIMAILNPTVSKLTRLKIPRAVSIILIYLFIFAILSVAIVGIVPPLVEQSTNFASGLPKYLENLGISLYLSDQIINQTISQIGNLSSYAVRVSLAIFSNVLAVITVFFFTFYLLLARDRIDDQFATIFGESRKKFLGRLLDLLEIRLGGWARGEMILMLFIGLANFIGFTILGIPYSLPLALIAGLLEIVPTIGPIIAAIPAVIIAFSISPLIGVATIALVFLIQQLENYILVPKIMEKSVGVSPIITLLCLAIGLRLAGFIGVLISVPVFISLQVLFKEYYASK